MACGSLCLGAARSWMAIAGVIVPSLSASASRRVSGKSKVRMAAMLLPMTLLNPKDPFLSKLSSIAASSPDILSHISSNYDNPPFLDLFDSPTLMATPAQEDSISASEDDIEGLQGKHNTNSDGLDPA